VIKAALLLCCVFLIGCGGFNSLTKSKVDEFCAHSEIHRDIIILGLTDKMFEPHSIHVHCGSEYGFAEKE